MKIVILVLLAGVLGGCAGKGAVMTAYWSRPGATLPDLASESDACYQAAVDLEAPSALPGPTGGPRLLPRSMPPPKLWSRLPRDAGFERFDEQLKYERCMTARGWVPAKVAAPTL
jgi:hypothetical protein